MVASWLTSMTAYPAMVACTDGLSPTDGSYCWGPLSGRAWDSRKGKENGRDAVMPSATTAHHIERLSPGLRAEGLEGFCEGGWTTGGIQLAAAVGQTHLYFKLFPSSKGRVSILRLCLGTFRPLWLSSQGTVETTSQECNLTFLVSLDSRPAADGRGEGRELGGTRAPYCGCVDGTSSALPPSASFPFCTLVHTFLCASALAAVHNRLRFLGSPAPQRHGNMETDFSQNTNVMMPAAPTKFSCHFAASAFGAMGLLAHLLAGS